MKHKHLFAFLLGLLLILGWTVGNQFLLPEIGWTQGNVQLTVSAAASLTNALKEITPLYQQASPTTTLRYNFASSGALQQQIEQGAPADVFISAATQQMDALQQKNLLLPGSRRNLLTNRLVLIVPRHTSGITHLNQLTRGAIKRLAIGDPRSVPAGQYAAAALTKQGIWTAVQSKVVRGNTVRQVLQFVESGNAQAGIVYATDAKTSDKVKVVQMIPETWHDPIVYPIAVVKRSKHQTAASNYSQFLSSNAAKRVFQRYGFGV